MVCCRRGMRRRLLMHDFWHHGAMLLKVRNVKMTFVHKCDSNDTKVIDVPVSNAHNFHFFVQRLHRKIWRITGSNPNTSTCEIGTLAPPYIVGLIVLSVDEKCGVDTAPTN